MSLPPEFSTAEEYFEAGLQFFHQYQFLFSAPNTDLLLRNTLDQIDLEGIDHIDLRTVKLNTLARRNRFLNRFYHSGRRIKANIDKYEVRAELEVNDITVPLGPKKKHEIVYLAREIEQVCERVGCRTVVDFGSGLGYLDQRLYERTSYNVLGLECNEAHYVAAKKRQRKYHENSLECVKYMKHTISADSHADIESFVLDKFGKASFCIAGLHACADLTIDALNIFLKLAEARSLVLMPCCYHKMAEVNGRFANFPLSCCMRAAFERREAWEFLAVPFLRLGAQPRVRDLEGRLDALVFSLLARAALQLYAHTHNCKIKRNKRKAVKTPELEYDFEKYIQQAVLGFTLVRNDPSAGVAAQFDLDELRHIWKQISLSLAVKKAQIFVILQNAVQELVENFILFDRLMFLRENGIEKCAYKKIFNENVSPRALALIAYK